MATDNQHKLKLIDETSEHHQEKGHVKLSNIPKFRTSTPNSGEKTDNGTWA